jgi:hypothetical protein
MHQASSTVAPPPAKKRFSRRKRQIIFGSIGLILVLTTLGVLASMAALARLARVRNGAKDIVLYAHGGLVAETAGAQKAAEIWKACREKQLTAYFFVWETGITESLLGNFKSRDDARGPQASLSWQQIKDKLKNAGKKILRKAESELGKALAGPARTEWNEMLGRAQGASVSTKGGASKFIGELFMAMDGDGAYRLHIVGHSAGSVYTAWLYATAIRPLLKKNPSVTLHSINWMAPAIRIDTANEALGQSWSSDVPTNRFFVWTLKPEDEDTDAIGIYPSSLLTYVADHLSDADRRVPILGIRSDLDMVTGPIASVTRKLATKSTRHGEFDDNGFEVDDVISWIASS